MDKIGKKIIEEIASSTGEMDLQWMVSFWETFTDCTVQLDAEHNVTNIRRNAGSSFTLMGVASKPFFDIAADKDRAFVTDSLNRLKTVCSAVVRFQSLAKNGRYYRWTLIPICEDGEYLGCRGVAVDVTEQTLKEITLNWQRAIIEEGNDFVCILDLTGKVLYANSGAFRIAGYAIGSPAMTIESLFSPEYIKTLRGDAVQSVREFGFWLSRGELIHADGRPIPIEHSMFSIRNEHGEMILIANIIRDITVFLNHEKELEAALSSANAANAAKSDFLSRMSHEMRTPLNAIIGMTSIGKSAQTIEKKDYAFNKIDGASKHLLGVINDVLDMAKIEAGKLELSTAEFNFETMLRKVTDVVGFRVDERKQHLYVNIDHNIPRALIGDDQRLTQVITNLLSNAVKFTPEQGNITVDANLLWEENDICKLQISVTDTGIGINDEQKARLFKSFEQAEAATSRKYGGTGLGLAISKRIVELMGGKVWVESAVGKGSKFAFTALFKRGTEERLPLLAEGIDWNNIRIFAVDDEPEVREFFMNTAANLGIVCHVAASGEEASELLALEDNYDIYFLDWNLPGMNGIELARRMREKTRKKSVVILFSSVDWSHIEADAKHAGIDKFLPKPLYQSSIVDVINECLGFENFSKQIKKSTDFDDFSGSAILLVEDVEINREIVMELLEPTKLNIECAENGAVAVEMFKAAPDKYDMIFMDVQMPEMDGYEATRRIRAMKVPEAGQIPIVAMTANVFREDIEKCLSAGMDGHIGKPLVLEEIIITLRKYIARIEDEEGLL